MRYQMVIGLAAALSLSANGLANELEHGDCEGASNWAGAEPAWYSELCELPTPSGSSPVEGGGSGADAYALAFGGVSDPEWTGVLTYPMPDILSSTQLSATVPALFSADFDQNAGVLYAINNDDFSVGTVDLNTGAYTANATITGAPDTETLTGLAWDPTDGAWYLTVGSTLYSIDVDTGVATEIGPTGLVDQVVIDIKFDSSGQLYATTIGDDSLYAIDKTNASSTLIGALGFDITFAQGMAYDYSTDTMWAWLYQGGGLVDWSTIDLASGAATSVENFASGGPEAAGGILGGFAGGPGEIPESQPVPTLSTWGLIGLALLLGLVAVTAVRRARA